MKTKPPGNNRKESFLLELDKGAANFRGEIWRANLLFDFLDRGLFIFINVENLVQTHQFEDFFDVLTDGAESQFYFSFFAFFAKQDQLSNHRRRHKANVLEI